MASPIAPHPQLSRRPRLIYGERFEDIGDWHAVEIFQFPYGRTRLSVRRSDKLRNINLWLPLNYEDLFIGAIDRIDSREPIVRVPCLTERSLDNCDRLLCAALAAYDHRYPHPAQR